MIFPSTFEVPYPFVQESVCLRFLDELGSSCGDVVTWRPGARAEQVDEGESAWVSDGWGHMILTVVSTHKPGGRYHERVFYVRQWKDPDGLVFGKDHLRVTTMQAFKRLLKGHRYASTIFT